MFDNQSNTVNLLPLPHVPVAQLPLLLQPFGVPLLSVEQELQLISLYFYDG
jgi:hypothetical protein